MHRILVLEDDINFARIIHVFLTKHGFKVDTCYKLKDSIIALSGSEYDLLLLDFRLPDGTGMDLFSWVKENLTKQPSVIFMTSLQDIRTAVSTVKSGAFNYITKPVHPEELLLSIKDALSSNVQSSENNQANAASSNHEFLKGVSAVAKQLYEYVDLVAPTNMNVLILGESGTGKEHIARLIHNKSSRSHNPFVAVDCGTQSDELAASELFGHKKGAFTGAIRDKKGYFEVADGGTLFLDEVGNLSYETQLKLLRAIQEKSIVPVGSTKRMNVDIRLIAATNDDLASKASEGDFRTDLFHRLNEFGLKMPALRDRKQDFILFVEYFLNEANLELGKSVKAFNTEVLEVFQNYDWPGNLRELKNVIRRAVLLSKKPIAGLESIPVEMTTVNTAEKNPEPSLSLQREESEKHAIIETLKKTRYNKSKTALLLGIDRKTLYNKMSKYDLR